MHTHVSTRSLRNNKSLTSPAPSKCQLFYMTAMDGEINSIFWREVPCGHTTIRCGGTVGVMGLLTLVVVPSIIYRRGINTCSIETLIAIQLRDTLLRYVLVRAWTTTLFSEMKACNVMGNKGYVLFQVYRNVRRPRALFTVWYR